MLILASKSPRRVEMLKNLGVEFEVRTGQTDESHPENISPENLVTMLAKRKANGVVAEAGDVILSADTVVCLDGQILEKPKDRLDAKKMLLALSGRGHTVYTGYCIKKGEKELTGVGSAKVYFKSLDNGEIEWYLDTGEPYDKAGGYGIQGLGCMLVEKIDGDYNSVVGLPLGQVLSILRDL